MIENNAYNYKSKKKSSIEYIKVNYIKPNPYQPRKKIKQETLDELAASIKQYGVLHPISVRKVSPVYYELVAGERRLRASKIVGIDEMPCIIVNTSKSDSAILALIENLQREDLTFIEEAEGYNRLLSEHNITQEELALKIGKSQSTIANKIRLLKLSPMVKKMVIDNDLTERHARALLKVHDTQLQLKILKKVCDNKYNVKKTEDMIEKAINKFDNKEKKNDPRRTKLIRDIRIFVNTIKQAIEEMKNSGVKVRAAQIDKGEYVEFIIRIPKEQ